MAAALLEVGEEEPGGLTKTMRGWWRSHAEGVGAAHTTYKSTRGGGEVDRVSRRYGPKGRRSNSARVGATVRVASGIHAWEGALAAGP